MNTVKIVKGYIKMENLEMPEIWVRLKKSLDREEVLKVVKRVGRHGGFTPSLILLLEYYILKAEDVDWEEGVLIINYQPTVETALDLKVSARQLRRQEVSLEKLGAIKIIYSGNYQRHGERDEKGYIQYAFGVSLQPLEELLPRLYDLEKQENLI